MFNHHQYYSRLFTSATLVLIVNDFCFGINSESFNASLNSNFLPAVATWYGEPTGSGSGGACGFGNDVANPPYYGLISAGNNNLFQSGKGCGACYQVKCTEHNACSGHPIIVTITDECPGACNNEAVHFDLSGKAFGRLAKRGQANANVLRKAGRINIQYQRVPCNYKAGLTFKIDTGSNPYYLAFAIENLNKDGDIGLVELLASNSNGSWMVMDRSWGATWKVGLPSGIKGPYSVRITALESRAYVVAHHIIPANWISGQYYRSSVNLP